MDDREILAKYSRFLLWLIEEKRVDLTKICKKIPEDEIDREECEIFLDDLISQLKI